MAARRKRPLGGGSYDVTSLSGVTMVIYEQGAPSVVRFLYARGCC